MTPSIEQRLDRLPLPLLVWGLVGLLFVTAVVAVGFIVVDDRSAGRGQTRQLEEIAICERANIGRAVILANAIDAKDVRGERRIRSVSPLIDCVKAVRTSEPDAPLPPAAVDEILSIVLMNQTPQRLDGDPPKYTQ